MTYQNYFPTNYQPYQQPQQNNNSINWVQGEGSARAFGVAPGQSVLLMDSDSPTFYIKSADQSGMPLPLRIFDYKERTPQQEKAVNLSNEYITRDEFEKRINELTKGHTDESVIQSTEQ